MTARDKLVGLALGSAIIFGGGITGPVTTTPSASATDGTQIGDALTVEAPPFDLKIVLLQRIGGCESGSPSNPYSAPHYRQKNLYGSTATGAFQILRSTWVSWVRTFRPDLIGVYRRAMDAPPAIQYEIAMKALTRYGVQPWLASRSCWK